MPRETTLERRFVHGLELRTDPNSELPIIEGYGAKFNSISNLLFGYFYEVINPGYFDDVLKSPELDIRCLDNHDPKIRYGRFCPSRDIRTMEVSVDSVGLLIKLRPNDTQNGRDLVAEVRAGTIDAFSIGHWVADDRGDETHNSYPLRRLLRCLKIDDISFATYPAYPETASAELRTMYGVPQGIDPKEYAKRILERGDDERAKDRRRKLILTELG